MHTGRSSWTAVTACRKIHEPLHFGKELRIVPLLHPDLVNLDDIHDEAELLFALVYSIEAGDVHARLAERWDAQRLVMNDQQKRRQSQADEDQHTCWSVDHG